MTMTIAEWLEELPEPWRSEALENMMPDSEDLPVQSVADALLDAFRFEDTPQGGAYWWSVVDEFEDGE